MRPSSGEMLKHEYRHRTKMTADKMILDACVSVPESVKADRWVNVETLPGELYAVYHCQAEPENHDHTGCISSLTGF